LEKGEGVFSPGRNAEARGWGGPQGWNQMHSQAEISLFLSLGWWWLKLEEENQDNTINHNTCHLTLEQTA
jgi:hypothetical protein